MTSLSYSKGSTPHHQSIITKEGGDTVAVTYNDEDSKKAEKICRAVNHHDELMQVIGESVDLLYGDPSPEDVDAVRSMLNHVWLKVRHES